jgi:hypothetical protein
MDPRLQQGVFDGTKPPPLPLAEAPPVEAPTVLDADPLGPFAPPADHAFEPELREAVPRPIPAALTQGRHAQGKRKAAWGFLIVGVVLVASAFLPFMATLALYVLPLQFVGWIGLGCCIIAAVIFNANRSREGPYRYVREGTPLVVRIRDLKLRPTYILNGQTVTCRYFATVDYLDPKSGAPGTLETASNDVSAGARDFYTTSFRVGDYVTALYLPGEKASLRLYGFLDLRPDLGVVPRPGHAAGGVLRLIAVLLMALVVVAGLGWSVYAMGRFEPLELKAATVLPFFLIGALGFGLPMAVWMFFGEALRRRRLLARNLAAVETGEAVEWEAGPPKGRRWSDVFVRLVASAGLLLMGGIVTLGLGVTLNALLDDSIPQPRPVLVKDIVQVTHNFILREYKIEYSFPDEPGRKHSMLSSPEHLRQFDTNVGVAAIRSGRFGWPWVETIVPLRRTR